MDDNRENLFVEYPWFALRVKTRYERTVSLSLRGKGYQEFLPTYSLERRWAHRTKILNVPLFTGYVFCRFDAGDRLPILQIPAVIDVVRLGKTPLPVDESEILSLQIAERAQLFRRPCAFLEAGELVHIRRGPLAGLKGIVQNVKGDFRLVLSVTLLQRSVSVEIESHWVASLRRRPSRVDVRTADEHFLHSSA